MKDLLESTHPFISAKQESLLKNSSIYLLGYPFDGTTSFRPGARQGPYALREASSNLETYSPYIKKDLTDFDITDLGNLEMFPGNYNMMLENFQTLLSNFSFKDKNAHLITIGGEHSISYGPITHYLKEYDDLLILHLDAHADLRDGYLGHHYSHASIIRRILDHFGHGHEIKQYGIRSGTKEEFEKMEQLGSLFTDIRDLTDFLELIPVERPIYLTLDLDFFDPSMMPGTGTPEAGGASFHDFIKIMKILSRKNFVGSDIVELAPILDPSGISNSLAAKVVREIILSLNVNQD